MIKTLVYDRMVHLERCCGLCPMHSAIFTGPLGEGCRFVAFLGILSGSGCGSIGFGDDPLVIDNGGGAAFLSELESVMEQIVASVKEES